MMESPLPKFFFPQAVRSGVLTLYDLNLTSPKAIAANLQSLVSSRGGRFHAGHGLAVAQVDKNRMHEHRAQSAPEHS